MLEDQLYVCSDDVFEKFATGQLIQWNKLVIENGKIVQVSKTYYKRSIWRKSDDVFEQLETSQLIQWNKLIIENGKIVQVSRTYYKRNVWRK
jgi:predicted nicotinamide N-methyase